VSRRYLAAADVVLFCAEAGRPLDAAERAPAVLVRTKLDRCEQDDPGDGIAVSVVTGEGLALVRAALAARAFARVAEDPVLEPFVTRARHRIALERARGEIEGFRTARSHGVDAAVAATPHI